MLISNSSCCSFDILFSRNVPHVLARIFLELSPDEFESCREVCKKWRNFIDGEIYQNSYLKKIVAKKKLVHLWKDEDFTEQGLDLTGSYVEWTEWDVEAVSAKGDEIFLFSEREILKFCRFKFQIQTPLPTQHDRVKHVFVGDEAILVVSKYEHRHLVYKRSSLELISIFTHARGEDDQVTFQSVEGTIYLMQREGLETLSVYKLDDHAGTLNHIYAVDIEDHQNSFHVAKSVMGMNSEKLVLAFDNGSIHLISHKRETMKYSRNYSKFTEGNLVEKIVLTQTYFGVVFTEKSDDGINFKIFSVADGNLEAFGEGISAFGRTYFSATDNYFVFSYADPLYNQHFLLHHCCGPNQWIRKKCVLMDRPQPMRSMQIIQEKVLMLSFYRTASALNVFDIEKLMSDPSIVQMEDLEIVKKLPPGVIAFQSSHHTRNGQNLVLYNDTGVLCQRLNYTCENLVFCLKFGRSSLPTIINRNANGASNKPMMMKPRNCINKRFISKKAKKKITI